MANDGQSSCRLDQIELKSSTANSLTFEWSVAGPGSQQIELFLAHKQETLVGCCAAELGTFTFYFLQCNTSYTLSSGCSHETLSVKTTGVILATGGKKLSGFRLDMATGGRDVGLYVGNEHSPDEWMMRCTGDWMWTVCGDYVFITKLFECALFALPSTPPVIDLPNPLQRYCIDLKVGTRWDKNKKMRKALGRLKMTINRQYKQSLEALVAYHQQKHGGTWMNAWLLQLLTKMSEDMRSPVQQMVFEMWEGEELVALTAGFGTGSAFHDYSMATLKRDQRGLGKILTKVVGQMLCTCGYDIWYWGYKSDYMEYFDQYGGRHFDRQEFWNRWDKSRQQPPAQDLGVLLEGGGGLVQWKEPVIAAPNTQCRSQ
jgi:Leu/Phe-tRNA-protein transferase